MPMHFKNPTINEPFVFESIGNRWTQDRIVRPKGYPFYHYLQTESGCGTIEVQEHSYVLDEGEGILIAPYLSHSYGKNTEDWFVAFATFTGTIDSSIDKMVGNRPVIFIEKEQGARIGALIDEVMENWEALSLDTHTLSTKCYCLLMNFTDSIYTRIMTDEPLYLRYVEPVLKEIEAYYDEELTVQELSRKVYITPQYLSRLFRRFLDCSVYGYLTSYRINRAREFLVSNPRMEVQQVAAKTGFTDASHFIAMFKKATGVTPLEFRRMS